MDYGAILKRSWELTKKHKWLWVYGLVLAALSGGGGGGSSSGTSFKDLKNGLPKEIPEKTSQVLGQTINAIQAWFRSVPVSIWLLLGVGAFLLILLFVVIAWVIRSWAKGALIAGLHEADQSNDATLVSTSPKGLAAVRPLVIFGLIAFGITLATILSISLVVFSGYWLFSFAEVAQKLWLVFSVIVGGLSLIVLLVLFAMVSIYADRQIVLQGVAPWPAWKNGFRLARYHFFPTLVMGIINNAVGCTVGCVSLLVMLLVLGIPAAILIIPLFKDGFRLPSLPVIAALILFFLVFVGLNLLVRAILVVFRYGTWNLFFQQILEEEQHHE